MEVAHVWAKSLIIRVGHCYVTLWNLWGTLQNRATCHYCIVWVYGHTCTGPVTISSVA